MSQWTYVNGVIEVVTPARSSAEAVYLAETVVNHLPRISGDNNSLRCYLNLVNGYNSSSSHDEFLQYSNLYNSYFHAFDFQTNVLITMSGLLFGKSFRQTLKETTKMLSRLSAKLMINRCVVSVSDILSGQRYVFDDPAWLICQEQTRWARDLLWEFDCETEGGNKS